MLLIGSAAGAASFRHVHDVAAAHGQPGPLAWADAVVLELTSIAAGLELRRNRRLGKSVAFPAIVLTVAVFLSLAAQVVEAEASVIGWVAAALPALGFLTMVKIALGRADPAPPDRTARMRAEPGPALIVDAAVPDRREPVPGPRPPVPANTTAVRDRTTAVRDRTTAVRDRTTAVPALADQEPAVPDRPDSATPVRDRGPEIAALVPAARTAARALSAEGTLLSRKELADSYAPTGTSCPTPPPQRSCASCALRPPHPRRIRHMRPPDEPSPATPVRPRRPRAARVCQEARRLSGSRPSVRTWPDLSERTRGPPAMTGRPVHAPPDHPPDQGATSMLIQFIEPNLSRPRCHRPASHVLSHHGYGVAGRVGVGVDLRFTVRLDADPRTDPLTPLTAQVRPAFTGPDRFQTHPMCWVSPRGAAHA
ncbi:DUF2637 domain-containing protein [Micromonospora sp. DR5-3]|uniref:DUF2637 domain-containing protein n=1 Tax=unclassified Micromonospora TaxID=2617518 RepID=UPI002101EC9F|nr:MULTISPECIES: DUF2637 domain-containing protein [unclassified Micromonospora]MCW3815856.1 DUF2637 domain-containing protein [Micromonospora sp. DR5-3]